MLCYIILYDIILVHIMYVCVCIYIYIYIYNVEVV